MLTTRWTRAIAVLALSGTLFIACVGFGTLQPAPADGRYPHTGDIVQHPDRYDGESVVVNGEVVTTQPLGVEASYSIVRDGQLERGTVPFTITNTQASASVGDTVQVYGVFHQVHSIHVNQIVVTPSRDIGYMYVISALAGVCVLGRLLRQWRFDPEHFAVAPRNDPIRLADYMRQLRTQNTEEETDA